MIANIILEPLTNATINRGANILHVIPLTNMTPAIIAHNKVVPKSFCNRINAIGIMDTPKILKITLNQTEKTY